MNADRERAEWLRSNHAVRVVPAYRNTSAWSCSCGAGDHTRTMPNGAAQAAKTRHLRAQERKYDRTAALGAT